jgi:predicted nucleotidyltransferase
MLPLIESRQAEIAALCRRYGVSRLDVFGSAARGADFDSARSDVDMLVTYLPGHSPSMGEYLALRDALSEIVGRPVDLVMAGAVDNPFVRAGIERSRRALYGA